MALSLRGRSRQCCLNMCVIAIFCTAALVLPLPLSICSHPNQAAYAKHLPSPRHPTKASLTKPPQLTVSKFTKQETENTLKHPQLPARTPEDQSALPPSSPEYPKPERAKSLRPPPLPARTPETQSAALPPSSPESPPPPPTRKPEAQSALPPSSPESSLPPSSPSTSIHAPNITYDPAPGAEAKLKAAQAKAEKLGGVDKLTPKDIEGLSIEQIKQLRGY